ncbi:MAG TPA: hypothetical protein PKY82_02715 [Pyrinomonadaceae bacterium]|nr:hypothetical protein [Pyrinomonadaceae bacterium]
MKIRINAFPIDSSPLSRMPYQHLEPVVETLLKAGNQPTYDTVFYVTQGGWEGALKKPIDFNLLREKFEFPESIVLNEAQDSIFCKNTWIEIRGNVK